MKKKITSIFYGLVIITTDYGFMVFIARSQVKARK